MIMSFREWFTDIERRKRHKDVCLQEGDEELEEPERKRENLKCTSIERWNHIPDIDSDRYQDRSDQNIEEETHRKGADSDEFSEKVEPSDEDIHDFLGGSMSMIVE